MNSSPRSPRITVAAIALSLVASPALAGGHRYAWEIPGVASMTVDPLTVSGGIHRNVRLATTSDFGAGEGRHFGGTQRAYVGANEPFAGDFNGDGFDDVGVRWTAGPDAGKWTISLNDKAGNFLAGKGVSFGGTVAAYVGSNRLFVGDFNGDGFDDIGVHWKSGPNVGKWTISLNDKAGNFLAGKGVSFGGGFVAYVGSNEPIVGDFDGDGFDDIGVRWTGGSNKDKWTVSRNDRSGNFEPGVGRTFGGSTKAYGGSNQPYVGDFDGDGRDDIGVRWTGGSSKDKWTISLSGDDGQFRAGRGVRFGGTAKAYAGDNRILVGDFDHDGFDDVGVKWVSGTNNGLWVFSRNERRAAITRTAKMSLRVPVVFVNVPGQTTTTPAAAQALLDEVHAYFLSTTHGGLDVQFKHRIVTLSHDTTWTGGVPDPVYGRNGKLTNGRSFPAVEDFEGYWCRFALPGSAKPQIIFKDANGSLAWENSSNIHRNYCQMAERNFAEDALSAWASDSPSNFETTMAWASTGQHGPMFAMMAPGMAGGGNRILRESTSKASPLTIAGRKFENYIYLNQGASTLAHELGHMIGHGSELYGSAADTQCAANNSAGYLGDHALMGAQYKYFPAINGVNRWRFGFAEARYVTRDEGTVKLELSRAIAPSPDTRSLAVIHPDPAGHPDEVFVIEYRAKITTGGKQFDRVDDPGMYVYHVNAKDPSTDEPLIELLADPSQCPGKLVPYQNALSPTTDPALQFHDGGSAKFRLLNPKVDGGKLEVTVQFI